MKRFHVFTLTALSSFILFTAIRAKKSEVPHADVEKENMFGIDVSQYQGKIEWDTVGIQNQHPVTFVFIRATMGSNRKDAEFQHNWNCAKEKGLTVGAYHYYDPNQNSIQQAVNYLHTARLQPGDLIPVVDIERLSKVQTTKRLCLGLKRWLDTIEKAYGVKPILYSGHSFFNDYLLKEFSEYPLWVAAYSKSRNADPLIRGAAIHQYTDRVCIPGIHTPVDGNRMNTLIDSLRIR